MNKTGFRSVVLLVAGLNLSYFFVEIGVAVAINSVSLFADSVDFLEDTSVNLLIAVALSWSAVNRSRVGMALAGILLIPSIAALWEGASLISKGIKRRLVGAHGDGAFGHGANNAVPLRDAVCLLGMLSEET